MSGRAGAPSRDQAAFQWLLSREDEDEGGPRQQGGRRRSGGQQGRRRSSGRGGRPFIPGFQLREEAEGRGAAPGAQGGGSAAAGVPGLAALREAFGGLLPPDVVADVLAACGGDAAAASEALLGMVGGDACADAGPAMAAAAAPSAAQQAPGAGAAGGPCYLHLLPEEIKQLIFDQLSLRCVRWLQSACGRGTRGFEALSPAMPPRACMLGSRLAWAARVRRWCPPTPPRCCAATWRARRVPAESLRRMCGSSGASCARWWSLRACRTLQSGGAAPAARRAQCDVCSLLVAVQGASGGRERPAWSDGLCVCLRCGVTRGGRRAGC